MSDASLNPKRTRAALDAMPKRERTAFTLSRFEGKPHSEIAGRLGLSPPKVEAALGGALWALGEAAKAEEGADVPAIVREALREYRAHLAEQAKAGEWPRGNGGA